MSIMLVAVIVVIVVVTLLMKNSKSNEPIIIGQENNDKPIFENVDSVVNVNIDGNIIMVVEDVFNITGRGVVVTGKISNGQLQVGDNVNIQSTMVMKNINSTVTGIEMFRKTVTVANTGDLVGVLLRGVTKNDIQPGDYITK